MDNLVQFPMSHVRPQISLQIVGGTEHDAVNAAAEEAAATLGRRLVDDAVENIMSAGLLLQIAKVAALGDGKDPGDFISDEVVISLCSALISVIDAMGCSTVDRPLRRMLERTIEEKDA
ncbi:hypothetical protein FHX08_002043 [Rhizobium sp. BK529]|uniref:hypothetical protein n=1 Tax=Rhizobium sp. BK529 TaxID=2586983 RepID=UPI001612B990|nr:hypothetical protein [Rhizobium sp. BK529]MBB3591699.1 hypothetical protein [Rhizobium sp. BK529]